MGKILLFAILYISIPPGIFVVSRLLKNQIKRTLYGRRRSKTAIKEERLQVGINKKIMKRINFTLKDPRNKPLPFRLIFVLIYIIGLGVSIYGGYSDSWNTLLLSLLIAYTSAIFSYITSNKIVSKRNQTLTRMLELKGNRMKHINRGKGEIATIDNEFKVNEWSNDLERPVKMYIYMPTDFDILEVDGFLESFNLIFGGNGQWVADKDDKNYGGFNFNEGVAAIKTTAPLPEMADWHERYLDPRYVHWSFFPLAIGSENGVPIYNEELDKTENILGFAVGSGQNKLSKKNGVVVGDELVAAPQILIAGATGGGKALSSDTKIKRIKRVK